MQSTSVAERIVFGRPADPVLDDTPVRVAPRHATALIGRILISVIFLLGGIGKLMDLDGTAAYMTSAGIPSASTLAIVAAIAELAGGLALLFGFLTRLGALGLMVLVAIIAVTMHDFWNLAGAERQMQMSQFLKNLAIIGGLAMVFAYGPGRYSIDKKIRDPIQP